MKNSNIWLKLITLLLLVLVLFQTNPHAISKARELVRDLRDPSAKLYFRWKE